jgi:hemoglobin
MVKSLKLPAIQKTRPRRRTAQMVFEYEQQEKNMRRRLVTSFVVLLALLAFAGAALAKEKTLYERLGRRKAIIAAVDEFVGRVAADKRINKHFMAVASDPKRLDAFKMKLVDQICEASGGPCKYKGMDMKSAHAGMGITASDFDALVEDLIAALDKFKVGAAEKQQLLGVLGPMKSEIVTNNRSVN